MSFIKKFVSVLAISASVFLMTGSVVLASTLGSVNGDNVNIRSAASTDSDVITKYSTGQAVDIIGMENGFYIVDIDGANLFISSDYVDVLKAAGTVDGDGVNVRDGASTNAEVLTKLNSGEKVVAVGLEGDWLKIEHGGSTAYINRDFVSGEFISHLGAGSPVANNAGNTNDNEVFVQMDSAPKSMSQDGLYAVVASSTGLNLRSAPTTDSKKLTLVPSGEAVDVINQQSGWVQVSYAGYEGFLSDEYVQVSYGSRPVNTNGLASQIIEYGKQFLGTPYQWAGNDLSKGVDCSGFVYNVFKKFDISVNRSSHAMVNDGVHVDKENLAPGDLVLFSNTGDREGQISHVGIYMGNGNFIHSSSSKRTWGVVISSLNEDYYIKNYVTARRVL